MLPVDRFGEQLADELITEPPGPCEHREVENGLVVPAVSDDAAADVTTRREHHAIDFELAIADSKEPVAGRDTLHVCLGQLDVGLGERRVQPLLKTKPWNGGREREHLEAGL